MRLPFIGLLLLSSAAVAQTGPAVTFTSSTTSNTGLTISVPKSDCGTPRRFNWTRTSTNPCDDSLYIFVTTGTCGVKPAATDLTLQTLGTTSTTTSGSVSFSVSQVLAARGNGTDAGTTTTCDTQTSEISFNLCASSRRVGGALGSECLETFSNVGTPAFVVKYDPVKPNAPTIAKVIARDSALSVQVDGAEDDSDVVVEAAAVVTAGSDAGTDIDAGTTGPVTRATKAAGEGNVVINGLTNGVTYRLQATIIDAAGNVSDGSPQVDATPVKSNGLFDAYKDAGGQETGGCAAAGGGIAGGAVLAALGIWLSSRRKVS